MPRVMLCFIVPEIGFCVPASSALDRLKNEATSRHAANPMPKTYGSAEVNTTWYRRVASKPFFRQICVGSGVPGNGLAASHFAQAQSVEAMATSPETSPRWFSPVRDTSLESRVSMLAGLYGTGLVCTISGCESGPARLTMRPSTSPVMGSPFGPRATGTCKN